MKESEPILEKDITYQEFLQIAHETWWANYNALSKVDIGEDDSLYYKKIDQLNKVRAKVETYVSEGVVPIFKLDERINKVRVLIKDEELNFLKV